MKDISYGELVCCQDYAEKVIAFYEFCNNGDLPKTKGCAELIVREYNKERRKFKDLYGFSIRGYVSHIVDEIGYIVESRLII
jgi:hypothetical protein